MSDVDLSYIRREAAPTLPPPIIESGIIGWMRKNLFSSPLSAILTIASLVVMWFTLAPIVEFLIIDAVWEGQNREACLAKQPGETVGACWPFVTTRFGYFIYGLYPIEERWRPNLVFALGAAGIAWLLWPRIPFKYLAAAFFFVIYPIIAFILLTGFEDIGLREVPTNLWGGVLVTLVVSSIGIVASLPAGILLALGRRSNLPIVRLFCTIFIEFVRGVPLITVLFMASVMLPLFLPGSLSPDKLLRALVGVALFASAYMAEVVRGGLQALPRGQYEGAMALGLGYWRMTGLIILPQALKIVIPGIVNTFIGLFKDTTLVFVVGIFDLLKTIDASLTDPNWATPVTRWSGYVFAVIFYFVFCFAMSRYSMYVERRLSAGQRR